MLKRRGKTGSKVTPPFRLNLQTEHAAHGRRTENVLKKRRGRAVWEETEEKDGEPLGTGVLSEWGSHCVLRKML